MHFAKLDPNIFDLKNHILWHVFKTVKFVTKTDVLKAAIKDVAHFIFYTENV